MKGKIGSECDVAIIGAGPYGLSIAAHLGKTRLSFRIFGRPMQSWREQMPQGMLLKSEGFATRLYDPDESFTLRHYCEENQLPYADIGLPVPCEQFVAYGLEFQKRFVPMLEETSVDSVRRGPSGFELETGAGERVHARRVIVAAGISHFAYLPGELSGLAHVTHSSEHKDMSLFRGQKVAVIGAGASALDIAALLHEAGAGVELVARRESVSFLETPELKRSLYRRVSLPRSGLGLGWRSKLCEDAPLVFHAMPQKFRFRAVQRHLGPAPGWFVKDKVVGKFPMHLGSRLEGASVEAGKVHLKIRERDGSRVEIVADHAISATGYRVSLERLQFLDAGLRREIGAVEDTPVLSRSFESTVPGLYLVGVAAANSFGPLMRFACGARFTAKRVVRHLARHLAARV